LTAQESIRAPQPVARNIAVDAYRGWVMLLMMAEVLELARVAHAFPGNWFWAFLGYNQTHVEWAGCSLHDMIQPSFSFLVGVALPYSIASRMAKGGTFWQDVGARHLALVSAGALGIFLRSMYSPRTYFTFEDTLTQIGLGYPFLFLLGFRKPRWQWAALAVILTGYWLAWALYPVPGPGFDWQSVGVPANWRAFLLRFCRALEQERNLGNAFDQWFLNLFPRADPFVFNDGGYLTLSFIPTLGTMILGLVAGRWLRASAPQIPMQRLLAGVAGNCRRPLAPLHRHLPGGEAHLDAELDAVQRRSLLPVSGGVQLGDRREGLRKWAFPLVVIGMNSIAAYCIAHLCERFLFSSFRIHLGPDAFRILGPGLEPLLLGSAVLLSYWLILYWMYRRKLFLKI
jgi:heparan-alpha-glucosaminide N-acetyltransferase